MNSNILRSALAAATMCAVTVLSTQAPARADSAATTRTIIGAAAAIAGIATVVNVENKNRIANTVQGYLPDGSTVYDDGHVVGRNGYSWYPGNQGQRLWCSNQQCAIYGSANNGGYYNNNGYYNNGGYNNNGYGNNGFNGYNNYNNGYYNGNGYYNNRNNGRYNNGHDNDDRHNNNNGRYGDGGDQDGNPHGGAHK